jgi:hypothetical protein
MEADLRKAKSGVDWVLIELPEDNQAIELLKEIVAILAGFVKDDFESKAAKAEEMRKMLMNETNNDEGEGNISSAMNVGVSRKRKKKKAKRKGKKGNTKDLEALEATSLVVENPTAKAVETQFHADMPIQMPMLQMQMQQKVEPTSPREQSSAWTVVGGEKSSSPSPSSMTSPAQSPSPSCSEIQVKVPKRDANASLAAEIQVLNAENDKLSKNNDKLTAESEQLGRSYKTLAAALKENKIFLHTASSRYTQQKKILQQTLQQVRDERDAVALTAAALLLQEEKNAELLVNIGLSKSALRSAMAGRSKQGVEAVRLQEANELLSAEVEELSSSIVCIHEDLTNAERVNQTLGQQHKSLKQNHESLEQNHESLQQQYESLKQTHESLEQKHELLEHNYEALGEQHETLEEIYQPVQAENEQRKQMLADTRKFALETSRSRQDLCIPTKRMGELDSSKLHSLGVPVEQISLLQGAVCNPQFHPWRVQQREGCDIETVANWSDKQLDAMVQKYETCGDGTGLKVAEEVLRCNKELQHWNSSGGYCVTIPYHYGKRRELEPVELLKIAVGIEVPGSRNKCEGEGSITSWVSSRVTGGNPIHFHGRWGDGGAGAGAGGGGSDSPGGGSDSSGSNCPSHTSSPSSWSQVASPGSSPSFSPRPSTSWSQVASSGSTPWMGSGVGVAAQPAEMRRVNISPPTAAAACTVERPTDGTAQSTTNRSWDADQEAEISSFDPFS